MTVQELLKATLRALGVIGEGQAVTNYQLSNAREALNLMLGKWSLDRILVYVTENESLTLAVGTASYTMGSGGDLDTTRPTRIQGCSIKDASGFNHPVKIIGEEEYRLISNKDLSLRPERVYPDYDNPLITLYLDHKPPTAETFYIDSLKPFTEYTSDTTTIALPTGYLHGLKWNLAREISMENARALTANEIDLADKALRDIGRLNAANQNENVKLEVAKLFPGRSRFNILEG